jgi:hypothetical protein
MECCKEISVYAASPNARHPRGATLYPSRVPVFMEIAFAHEYLGTIAFIYFDVVANDRTITVGELPSKLQNKLITPYYRCQCFGGICCLNLQGRRLSRVENCDM